MTPNLSLAACVCLTALMMCCSADSRADTKARRVEIIAHRGESQDAPENTLASMNLAWARGADAVEMDLHLTKDGKLITLHDPDTFRVTGGKDNGGKKLIVLESTADELRKLDIGKWKGQQFAGEHMALVEEVLATLPPEKDRRLFIEVKVGPDAAAPLVAAIKKAGHPPKQTAVISFKLDTCAEVKKLMPELKVYLLADFKKDKKTGEVKPTIDELIVQAKSANLDGLDLSYKGPIDAAAVKRIRDAGLAFYVWTIDDPAIAKQMIDAGAEGVTTNRAQWMREQLGIPASKHAKS